MVTNTANMKQTAAKKHVRKIAPFTVVSAVILIILCLSLIIPFIWGLITAFKTPLEYVGDKLGFPTDWTLANFAEAFKNFTVKVPSGTGSVTYNVWGMLLWSAIYAVGGAIIQAMSCALVAYAVARFNKFKISKVLYSIVIITMILPIVGAMPSELRILRALGIYNTIFGMLILKANFLGAYFLMFHAFFSHIPKDYYEAAAIDGAGNFTILFRIVFPMVKTLFWTIVLLYFLGNLLTVLSSFIIESPHIFMFPPSIFSNWFIHLNTVDLPEPEEPIIANTSPSFTEKETFFTA